MLFEILRNAPREDRSLSEHFFDRDQVKISNEIANVIAKHLVSVKAIALSSDDELISATNALAEIVNPTVTLMFNARLESINAASRSALRPLIDAAYLKEHPDVSRVKKAGRLSENEALMTFIASLSASGFRAGLDRVLSKDVDNNTETPIALAISITSRLKNIVRDIMRAPSVSLVLSFDTYIKDTGGKQETISRQQYDKGKVDPEGTGKFEITQSGSEELGSEIKHFFLTKGGTTLVRNGEDIEEFEDEVDWESLNPYTVTSSDLEAARKHVAEGIFLYKKGDQKDYTVFEVSETFMTVSDGQRRSDIKTSRLLRLPIARGAKFAFLNATDEVFNKITADLTKIFESAFSIDQFVEKE